MYKKIFILLTLTLLISVGCGNKEVAEEDNGFSGKRNVKTIKSRLGEINSFLNYSGKIESEKIANASPSMSGKIEKLFVKEGDYVKTGDMLVKLDETKLEQTRIQFENAEKNFLRMQKLLENDAIDKQTFDEVKAGYNIIKSTYEFMLDNIEMKAPISGIVSNIYKKEGEKFDSMMDPFLIRIVNLQAFKAKLNISDKDINQVQKGQKAQIKIDNSNEIFYGTVSFISPEAEMLSGTFPIEISITNDSDLLKHNQFARISIITQTSQNAVIIPQGCVIDSKYVFLAKDGIARKKEVILGIGNEKNIEIEKGIDAGEEVIISGNIGLQAGDEIEIRN